MQTMAYNTKPTLIAGPCVIESMELLDTVAQKLVEINSKLNTNIIFKASFDKANRTSLNSFRGPGLEKGLQLLADIKSKYNLQITTDIHESYATYCRFLRFFVDKQTYSRLQQRLERL